MRTSFMRQAVALGLHGMRIGEGGPFGAVVVKRGRVFAAGWNRVLASSDPTAHAAMVAIRRACERLGSPELTDCDVYTSSEPCPMCLGAIYWARPRAVFFSSTREDAAQAGFDDAFVYDELALPPGARALPMRRVVHPEAEAPFVAWAAKPDRVEY